MGENRLNELFPLLRASEMGNGFACALLCDHFFDENQENAFRLAQFAATQRERDGFFRLGECFLYGVGCNKDLGLAKENICIAAELGHVGGAGELGALLDELDHTRWLWWSRAASLGAYYWFLDAFPHHIQRFSSGSGSARVMFAIGCALNGNINMEEKQIFGDDYDFDFRIRLANQAIAFHESQIKSARLAVDVWVMVALRIGVVKDIRRLISQLIWDARFEANYKISFDKM